MNCEGGVEDHLVEVGKIRINCDSTGARWKLGGITYREKVLGLGKVVNPKVERNGGGERRLQP